MADWPPAQIFVRGAGGTAGVSDLKKMLEVAPFPELLALRTAL